MAIVFLNQDAKKDIQVDLKKVIPPKWKWSLSAKGARKLILTITAAPIDLLAELTRGDHHRGYVELNQYHLDSEFKDKTLVNLFKKIYQILNKYNYDRSNASHDYFDVNYYVTVRIGKFDKPFQKLDESVIQTEGVTNYETESDQKLAMYKTAKVAKKTKHFDVGDVVAVKYLGDKQFLISNTKTFSDKLEVVPVSSLTDFVL